MWSGDVEIFTLLNHPQTYRAYAWSEATEGTRRRFHAVLGLPPADGPIMAVKTAVMAEYRTQNWEAQPARRWR